MKHRTIAIAFSVGLCAGLSAPVLSAADKETRQMMADIRMLQEQTQQLQNLIGSLGKAMSEALDASVKSVNARLDAKLDAKIDEQSSNNVRAFANQKISIDAIVRDVGVLREKMDESNVRVGSLTQEVDALRKLVTQINVSARPAYDPILGPPDGAPPDPALALAATTDVGQSPKAAFDQAYSEYTSSHYDLAIQGFEAFIRTFPTNPQAAEAQLNVCGSYLNLGNSAKAIETCDLVIKNYPSSSKVADAYYKKALALKNLNRLNEARTAFEYVVKTYPNSDAAFLADTQLKSPELVKRP